MDPVGARTVHKENPESLAAPVGLYSHVSVARPERLIFIAGQLAVDPNGHVVGEDDIERQIEQCFANVGTAVVASGGSWESITKMTTYLVDAGHIDAFYRVRERLYRDYFPNCDYPPNTLLVVARLVRPEFLVEIEGCAAL